MRIAFDSLDCDHSSFEWVYVLTFSNINLDSLCMFFFSSSDSLLLRSLEAFWLLGFARWTINVLYKTHKPQCGFLQCFFMPLPFSPRKHSFPPKSVIISNVHTYLLPIRSKNKPEWTGWEMRRIGWNAFLRFLLSW